MTKKSRGEKIDGWLALDKPAGLTSAKAVAIVRRLFNAAKAGHAGTLDPLATGILPIALGEATKTVAYAMDGAKTYRFSVRWGEQRSSDDAEGAVIAQSPTRPDAAAIAAALPEFTGRILQRPPDFSALKIAGQRAYDLARADHEVILEPRWVSIERLSYLGSADADHASFEMACGKGTYVRALARDLAVKLGTYGYVSALRRTQVGPFGEAGAISLDKLEALGHIPARLTHLLPVMTALDDIPALALTEDEANRLHQGQAVRKPRSSDASDTPPVLRAMTGDRLIALVRYDGDLLKSVRVLNL